MSEFERPNGNYLRGFARRLGQLLISRHRTDYDLGRMIEECRAGQFWRWVSWRDAEGNDRVGYPKFDHWTWAELGFKRRKADSLRENYNKLSSMDLDEKGVTFSRTMRLGWSKLNQLLRVARDEVTLIAWLDEVESKNLSYEELKAEVRWAIAEASKASTPTDTAGTGGDPDDPDAPEPQGDTQVRWPVVFESKAATEIVLKAHKRIQARFDGDIGLGKALAMMATHYLATTPRDDEGGAAVEAEMMIEAFEKHYGLSVAPKPAGVASEGAPWLAPGRRRRRRASRP